MSTSTQTSTAVLEVLQTIMALPDSQRTALRNAWDALDGVNPAGLSISGQTPLDEEGPLESFEAWLQSSRSLEFRPRVVMLRQALAKEDDEEIRTRLNDEIAAIKNQDRKFAVELAVTDFAYEHPFLAVLALAGVGVGLYRVTKGLWSIVF